jgi:hypothetical protein
MGMPDLGDWEPLSVTATIGALSGAPFRWWLSGGHALELHLGLSWRDHHDIDVGIARQDVVALRSVLAEWDIHIAAAGDLEPWTGDELRATQHQNNLWCRRDLDGPWLLDVTIGEGDDEAWIYRRDPSIKLQWTEAVVQSPEGIPYLAPELQLLFKSRNRREKDDIDAAEVIPRLEVERRDRLALLLPTEHAWQNLIAGSS